MENIILVVTVPDTLHRVIADSVTLEALKNSQEFYSLAFSSFVVVVSVLAIFLIAFTAIAVSFNSRAVDKKRREFEKFKEQYENKTKVLSNIIENYKLEQKEKNKKSPLEIDPELQKAINATFSDEQKKQTFINDYIRERKRFREDDPYTLDILDKFRMKKGTTEFIKYLGVFFEALSYWSEEKIYTWTLLSTKRKEAELSECMKHINSGKLEEFQIKCARFQGVIPETVFFLDPENYIT